ncbi:MAG: hypothetical protein K0M40_14305 [Prolixibacteraceae bacterium]|nr:hypothetical protein [Prolixibacteraceae bacterium]
MDIEKELFQKILIENCKLFPCVPFKDSNKIREIIESIICDKSKKPEIDTTDLETQIDQLVYQLYDLTAEEIAIIETT